MRRSDDIEIFSMSFLDLISCAMAGILVLYTIANRGAGPDRPRPAPHGHITLTFRDDRVGQLGFAVVLVNGASTGASTYEGSNVGTSGRWIFQDNPLKATLMLPEALKAGATLTIYVQDFDFTRNPTKYKDGVEVFVVVYEPKSGRGLRHFRPALAPNAFRVEQKL